MTNTDSKIFFDHSGIFCLLLETSIFLWNFMIPKNKQKKSPFWNRESPFCGSILLTFQKLAFSWQPDYVTFKTLKFQRDIWFDQQFNKNKNKMTRAIGIARTCCSVT